MYVTCVYTWLCVQYLFQHAPLFDIQMNAICEHISLIEGSLEVKLPTKWRDGKAEVGRVREEKERSEKIREKKQ